MQKKESHRPSKFNRAVKISLDKDYLNAVNNRANKKPQVNANTYKTATSAGRRIRDIVTTSRGGSISQELAEELWTDLLKDALELLSGDLCRFGEIDQNEESSNLPSLCSHILGRSQDELEGRIKPSGALRKNKALIYFDGWMLMVIVAVAHRIKKNLRGPKGALGIAQKIVNLTIKDRWALGHVNKQLEKVLHIPLDGRSLSHITPKQLAASAWKSWSLVALNKTSCSDYLLIQFSFRIFYNRMAIFQSTMDLDQVWWETMPFRK